MQSKPTGGSSSTTTATTYPDYVTDLQRRMLEAAGGTFPAGTSIKPYSPVGMTKGQNRAGDMFRANATASGRDWSGDIVNAGKGVTGEDIKALMNPYLDTVGKSTLDSMRRERDNAAASIAARSANGAAFGGSGDAIARGQLERGYSENVGSTIANLMSAGYDRATATALQNAQMGMNAAVAGNAAYGDTQQRRADAASNLFNYGSSWQALQQGRKDADWLNLQRLASLVPGVTGSTTQSTPETWNPLSTILGIGSMFL